MFSYAAHTVFNVNVRDNTNKICTSSNSNSISAIAGKSGFGFGSRVDVVDVFEGESSSQLKHLQEEDNVYGRIS